MTRGELIENIVIATLELSPFAMSFSALPPNVHDNIISHLVKRRIRGKPTPIAVAKTYSIVCRATRYAGQKVIWTTVDIEYSDLTSSLSNVFLNFQNHAHLHLWVKSLVIKNEVRPCEEADIASVLVMIKLLTSCRYLEKLYVQLPPRRSSMLSEELLGLAAELRYLRSFIIPHAPIAIDFTSIELFRNGFPRLVSLAFEITISPDDFDILNESLKRSNVSSSRAGSMERLTIGGSGIEPHQIPILLTILARALGIGEQCDCVFGYAFFVWTTMSWLALQSVQVHEVSFICHSADLVKKFDTLVQWLPKFTRLVSLLVNPNLSVECQFELDLSSTVSLDRFLSAIPPSIHHVLVEGIYFFGSVPYPEIRLKHSALALIEGTMVQFWLKTSNSQTFVTLKKMKDRKGRSRLHLVIEVSFLPLASIPPVVVAETGLALILSRSRFTALNSSSILPLSSSSTRSVDCHPLSSRFLYTPNESLLKLKTKQSYQNHTYGASLLRDSPLLVCSSQSLNGNEQRLYRLARTVRTGNEGID